MLFRSAHLSVSESEMSDSTSFEFECFHFEGMSDTPSEMRVVVNRANETILHSNDLPSTSSVFSYDVLGALADDEPSLEMMEDDEVVHKEATTTTTPTSHEKHNKGNIGVDDAMIPLVDMMNCVDDENDLLHAMVDFPCDTLPLHIVDHVELLDCHDITICMPRYDPFTYQIGRAHV